MRIQLSDHFTVGRLLRFTLPSILMMLFTSVYSIVDGLFVSNLVGDMAVAAVNFVMPLLMVLGALGTMLGTGGCALIAMTLGEGQREKANRIFTFLTVITLCSGAALAVVGVAFLRPLLVLMGAEGDMLDGCIRYGRIVLLALPFFMLQYAFQSFFVVAEKPRLGLAVTAIAGVANMALDALLVPLWGLEGAAAATSVSQLLGSAIPLAYFARPNTSLLRFTRFRFDGRALMRTCTNGSSELMSNVSMSLVSMLYNIQLLKMAGEDGVSAYGVLMYVNMIFLAIFIGYSVGVSPVIGYHYGAANHAELRSLRRRSTAIILLCSLCMFLLAEALARPLAVIFVGYKQTLCEMTVRAFVICSFSFLFSGFGIFGSSFFTALNDGLTSALISFLRVLVFQVAAVLLMPLFWGLDGVWGSIVVAEALAVVVTALLLVLLRKKYRY